jgi:hypothetical protein
MFEARLGLALLPSDKRPAARWTLLGLGGQGLAKTCPVLHRKSSIKVNFSCGDKLLQRKTASQTRGPVRLKFLNTLR